MHLFGLAALEMFREKLDTSLPESGSLTSNFLTKRFVKDTWKEGNCEEVGSVSYFKK